MGAYIRYNMLNGFITPVTGRISSKFGQRIDPVTKVLAGHNGIDIAVPIGTMVHCPAPGTIWQSYENDLGGKQLIIKHDNGYKTGYAHLSKNDNFPIAAKVKQGDVVALTGNTGKHTTGAHLHFTLTNEKGEKVDPIVIFQ